MPRVNPKPAVPVEDSWSNSTDYNYIQTEKAYDAMREYISQNGLELMNDPKSLINLIIFSINSK